MINSKLFLCNRTEKLLRKFEIWLKSRYCPKIPEIDLDFFRPKNKPSQFDHKNKAKSL